ncbi:MAG TPA: hypothetical protein VFS43_01945 [Polyangiaceae bacterium]|nr:hypothetical protein [Polyangiaceae bacterium]
MRSGLGARAGRAPARGGLGRALAARGAGPLLAAAAALAVVAYGAHVFRLYHRNVVDDALISLQYAKNIALGRGAVFNVGERVEGYTNFLWVAFLAPLYLASRALGADFVAAASGASVAFAAADVVLVYLVGRQIWGASPLPTALALGLCAVDAAYGVWAAMALEGHFLIFWTLLAAWLVGREGPGRRWPFAGLALAGVLLTRPDGALFAAAYGASEGAGALAARRRGGAGRARALARARAAAKALAACAGLYAVYYAWRASYYGAPLPNAYYFKVAGAGLGALPRGAAYVAGFFEERSGVPALAGLGLLALGHPTARLFAIYAALHLAYVASVGGDFYPGHRFVLVLVPAFALLAGAGLDAALRRWGPRPGPAARLPFALAAAALAALLRREFVAGYERGPVRDEVKRWGGERDRNRRFMRWLRDQKPPGASIAAGDVGAAGFYGEFDRVVDLLGVIDPVVARQEVPGFGRGQAGHEKWATPERVAAQRPTYIKFGFLDEDFTRYGYYLRGDLPPEFGVDGIWARDELAGRGRYDLARAFRFERARWADEGFAAEGDAFGEGPAPGPARRPGQGAVRGQTGGCVNSFHPERGDEATGRLVSRPFVLDADKLVVRVGGGRDPERLRVSLVVDGERAFSATGRDRETLTRHVWDVAPLRGKAATIEAVDARGGPWGHLLVDEIVPWVAVD